MVGNHARRRLLKRSALAASVFGLAVAGAGSLGAGAALATPDSSNCTANVDGSGLSAAVVASSGQTIANQTIDAAPCDIGIYVGVGVSDVTIRSVTVEGANFQGIFAQDASYVTIEHSTVTDNAFGTVDTSVPPLPGSGVQSRVGQSFAISLFGVSHSTVADNTVYNNGRGGIGVMDNGPHDPGTITQSQSAPLTPSTYDTVTGNREWANYNGCGVVAATQNFGGSLSHLLIAGNRITGTQTNFGEIDPNVGADVGGIVVAADPPASSVTDALVSGNSVSSSFEGGVIVNAEAFDSFTQNVYVLDNQVSANNWGAQEAPDTAGIIVYANPGWDQTQPPPPPGASAPQNIGTVVAGNHASDQFYGIWTLGSNPLVYGNHIKVTPGGTPIAG